MDALCQRWHVAPSSVLAEDAALLMALIGVAGSGDAPVLPSEDEQRLMTLIGATTVGE